MRRHTQINIRDDAHGDDNSANRNCDYVIAVQTAAYRLSDTSFAVESAFYHHLKQLKNTIDLRFTRMVIIAPQMSYDVYEKQKSFLGILTSDDGIYLAPTYPESVSAFTFWTKHAARIYRDIKHCLGDAGIVHSGMSSDIWRPVMAMVNLAAWRLGKPVMFIVDIDFRLNFWRMRRLGMVSLKSYLTNLLFHDPLRWIQLWLAPRMFDLVLLKSPELVRDFGHGRPHVKNFLNTVHSEEHILTDPELEAHLTWLCIPETPLRVVYFGRLVAYKGIDRAIEAVRIARADGHDIRLTIIGDGPCREDLHHQADLAGLEAAVTFMPPVAYGRPLFQLLSGCHLSIATPLSEDTPRSAFDSMARGLPVLAFGLAYFVGLAELSEAVVLATWPDPDSLAHQIVALSTDRKRLAEMARRAVKFAKSNTQQIWLERRCRWVMQFMLGEKDDRPKNSEQP